MVSQHNYDIVQLSSKAYCCFISRHGSVSSPDDYFANHPFIPDMFFMVHLAMIFSFGGTGHDVSFRSRFEQKSNTPNSVFDRNRNRMKSE